MSLRSESFRFALIGIALWAGLSFAATALGQPQGQNVSQEGTSRAGSRNNEEPAQSTSIDAQTGKIINEAIELMNAENYAAAAKKTGTVRLNSWFFQTEMSSTSSGPIL